MNNISLEVTRILERTAANAFKLQDEDMLSVFEEAKKTCLGLVSTKELKLEVNRRVAEWKMKLLCDRNSAFEVVNELHDQVIKLGYTNLEAEGSLEIYFAQYCERVGYFDVALDVLNKLRVKLEKAFQIENLLIYQHLLEVSDEIVSRVKQNKEGHP